MARPRVRFPTPRPFRAAPGSAMPCTWTPSGVHLVLVPGLTIAADDLALDRYGQKALVTVQWRGQVCHRQRLNLDDPRQRKTFVERLVLAGQQAGMTLQTQPLRRMANRVTPAVLMRVGEACRQRPPTPPRSPAEEQAERARTIAAAEHAAGALLNDPAILDRVGDAMWANGYAGDLAPAVLAYVDPLPPPGDHEAERERSENVRSAN